MSQLRKTGFILLLIILMVVIPVHSIVFAGENSILGQKSQQKDSIAEIDQRKNFPEMEHEQGTISDEKLEVVVEKDNEHNSNQYYNNSKVSLDVAGETTKSNNNNDVLQQTFTKDTNYFQVIQSNVTIYENSTGKLVPVGRLTEGTVYPLKRVLGDWIEIQFSDRKGYVWKPAAIPSDNAPKKTGTTQLLGNIYIMAIQDLPVYDNSTGKLIEIGKIFKGEKYRVIRQYGDWMEILFSGRIGYVYKTGFILLFSKETKYFQVMQSNVTVYTNNTGKLVPVGRLTEGIIYPLNRVVGDWIEIQFSDKKGYVWKPATIPSDKAPKKTGTAQLLGSIYITAIQDLPVYDNSTGKLIEIGRIFKGEKYKVIRQYGDWMEILFSGRIGYVYNTGYALPFTKDTKYFQVIEPNVTVYDNSTGKLVPVGKLIQGEVYPIGKMYGDWLEIQFGNKKGYIWKDATKPYNKAPKKLGNSSINKNIYFEATQNLPIYDNSTGKLIQIGTLIKGIQYPIINQYGDWIEILFAGRIGYVYKTGIQLLFASDIKYFKASEVNVQIVENINGKLVPIGKLVYGQTYERISDYGDWHKIRFGNRIGFVWKPATTPLLSPNYKNPDNGPGSNLLQTKMKVTVYDNSSGSLVPFATIEKGVNISYISKLGDWYKVSLLGREGYIYASGVKVIAKDIVNPYQTYTYAQMEKDILELTRIYPDLIKSEVIGKSVDERNLYALKLGHGKTEIFFNAAHHAREHITTNLLMEMIDTYAQSYVKNTKIDGYNTRDILNKTSIWFVPMVNPDGVTLVQLGHKSAKNPDYVLKLNNSSTNFNAWKANIRGVDLNRQYPAEWNNIQYNTGKPGPKNYKGPKPLSEPEAKALYDFTLAHDFKTGVAYHSTGEILYWYFKQDSSRYNRESSNS